ncbi:Zinc knuckle CX2CX4HX4C, partial [Parasponia andersonii]
MKKVEECEGDDWGGFRWTPFWIQIHRLPLHAMNEDTRLFLDITTPVRRGANARVGSRGNVVWANFRYEKMLDFCFGCGHICHIAKECLMEESREIVVNNKFPFRNWLKELFFVKLFDRQECQKGPEGSFPGRVCVTETPTTFEKGPLFPNSKDDTIDVADLGDIGEVLSESIMGGKGLNKVRFPITLGHTNRAKAQVQYVHVTLNKSQNNPPTGSNGPPTPVQPIVLEGSLDNNTITVYFAYAMGKRKTSTLERENVGKYLPDIKERLKCSQLFHTELRFKKCPTVKEEWELLQKHRKVLTEETNLVSPAKHYES